MIDTSNIVKNSYGFDFVETLGSFINNLQFKQGNDQFLSKKDTKDAYLWSALSSIGDKYAETIYENAINYIDNVSNIDLCKVKALQSMIQIVGLQYNVFNTFKTIPVEIANLMDILSINRSYLLNSKVFKQSFIDYLSSIGCIEQSTASNSLSDELSASYLVSEDDIDKVSISDAYVNEDKYRQFLENLYRNMIKSYIYLRYADSENGLPTTNEYIYQYIQSDILASQTNANITDLTPYQQKMSKLKIKYNVNKDFDQSKIIDDVENGYDSVDKYNVYEQEILKAEIQYREQTYAYPKKYSLPSQSFLGFNLTRYSYYREKKVKEYFKFIDNTYNSLMIESGIADTIAGRSVENDVIATYDKDVNYFDIDQANSKTLLTYDPLTEQLEIQVSYIDTIAKLLANQTLQIAEIRDQVKLQIRKSYMRGTFLLMSYIVNEFLRYGILNKYGSSFSTDDGVDLGTILNASMSTGNNVQLIEYYDDTEYFNITTSQDKYALYSETTNEKFWDNAYSKVGVKTEDIPLDEIEYFYLKQLNLDKNHVDDIKEFLSIVYEYGANNSYINRNTGEFTCQLRDGRWIGDPYVEISSLKDAQLSINTIHDAIDDYIANGYTQSLSAISVQLDELCVFVSSYYWNEISSANDSIKENTVEECNSNLDKTKEIDEAFQQISATYENLKNDSKYRYYLTTPLARNPYVEILPAYFAEKINNFNLSIENGIDWSYWQLNDSLNELLRRYYDLSSLLYDNLFALSVWQIDETIEYWPHYSPNYSNELTSVTYDLKNFLIEQTTLQNEQAMQHLQNHYDKLITCKNQLNQIAEDCIGAKAHLDSFILGVQSRMGIDMSEALDKYEDIAYWSEQADLVEAKKIDDGDDIYYEPVVKEYGVFWITDITSFTAPALDKNASIEEQLDVIAERTNYPSFDATIFRKNKLINAFDVEEYGWCTDTKVVTCYYNKRDDGSYEYTEEITVPSKYTMTSAEAYDLDMAKYPWHTDADADAANDILATYNNAILNIGSYIAMANEELTCLGMDPISYDESISPESSNDDDIMSEINLIYEQITDRVNAVDEIIKHGTNPNGWPSLVDKDKNLEVFKLRLDRIDEINNIEAQAYNIQYIDSQFYELQNDIVAVLTSNSDYFDEYTNNDTDRLDLQINAMSVYMQEKDKTAKDEVSSQLCAISVDYYQQLSEFDSFSLMLKRDEVFSILDTYEYVLKSISYRDEIYSQISSSGGSPYDITRYSDCLDYLLSGDYIDPSWNQKENGVLYWIPLAIDKFEDSAVRQINLKIPTLDEYIKITSLIHIAKTKFLNDSLQEVEFLTDKLDELTSQLEDDIVYISSQIDRYDAKKEIYLKYNGTEIGYDPFYNYKNKAYSSYQIHPYLYNFVEKTNSIYPLANTFFVMFTPEYEKTLYENNIDKILGPYGNIKDLWKSGMFDWTSYQTKYEHMQNSSTLASDALNPSNGFTGLFYPPALCAFMSDPDAFIQNVQDNSSDSYYYHLNLTNEQIDKIIEQLIEYEPMIRTVSQRWNTISPSLSNEFDIYKYADDAYGNSLFLLKNYSYLYEQHKDEVGYLPSYNEKKNAVGEVWMRIKNHPLAFPAFDLRNGYEKIAQYNVISVVNSIGKPINGYIKEINDLLISRDSNNSTDLSVTIDTVGQCSNTSKKQHLRCFLDMELDPTLRSLLLVAPFYTGKKAESKIDKIDISLPLMTYANSSIIVSFLNVAFDYNNNIYTYDCYHDVYNSDSINVNINNIANENMLVRRKDGRLVPISTIDNNSSDGKTYTQFIGFAANGNIIYAIFAYKNVENDAFGTYQYKSFSNYTKVLSTPRLRLRYVSYKCHTPLNSRTIESDDLKYDIFSMAREPSNQDALFNRATNYYKNPNLFKYAENIVLASGDGRMTVAFVSERTQASKNYDNNISIVNFVEYNAMVEDRTSLSTYGENIDYPRSTAMIQTADAEKINIYNSFDSFVQHLVNVNFKLVGTSIMNDNIQYFNLNSDLGFLPQYADVVGKSRIYNNVALSGKQTYQIEMLGPEKSDVPFTPVIEQTSDEKNGRVVEEYKDYETAYGYNNDDIEILSKSNYATYEFDLSSIFGNDKWNELTSSNDLLRYKYILYNTKYEAQPLFKGNLSDVIPTNDYYQKNEAYDLLSGVEIIGPNIQTYQNINLTNHITNVSNIELSVIKDEQTFLPNSIIIKLNIRQVNENSDQIIPKQQFRLFLYLKNTLQSYEYYHIFENPNSGNDFQTISGNLEYSIDFKTISSLKDYEISGIYPFKNKSNETKYEKMSADLEFKYSEEDLITNEFPYLGATDIEDDITIVQNDNQNIYFFAIDSFDTLSTINPFKMEVYDPNSTPKKYVQHKIMPTLPKYKDFYDRALTIEATYNIESISNNNVPQNITDKKYEIVQYFNYKNFTNPQYMSFTRGENNAPPSAYVYNSTSEEIKHSWLALHPGESGRLDISVDFLEYGKLNDTDIEQSVLGMYVQNIATYYIMNVSDDKPKFIISRKPFSNEKMIEDTENYEIEDAYYSGMVFRYMMLVIKSTRGMYNNNSKYGYVGISKIKFYNKLNEHDDEKIFNDFGDTTVTIEGGNVIEPNKPINLIKYGKDENKSEFLASNVTFPLSIMFDMKERIFDVEQWPNWEWLNAGFSNSHSDFIPKEFYIAFSNDMKRWYMADHFNDTGYSIPTTNWQLGYAGKLSIDINN